MTRKQNPVKIGGTTESAIVTSLKLAGFTVFMPAFDNSTAIDLMVCDFDGSINKIQCKTGRIKKNAITFNTCSVDWTFHPGKTVTYTKTSYRGLIDFFAVFCETTAKSYIVPVEECGTSSCSLRISSPRSVNGRTCKLADLYEIKKDIPLDSYKNLTVRPLKKEKSQCSECGVVVQKAGAKKCGECVAKHRAVKKSMRPPCATCGKIVPNLRAKYCEQNCYRNSRQIKPSKEQLELELQTMTWVAIGDKYKVSDNAVRKWARKYRIAYTPRKYAKTLDAGDVVIAKSPESPTDAAAPNASLLAYDDATRPRSITDRIPGREPGDG